MSSGDEKKLMEELQDFRKDFGIFVTKLMGDEDKENPEGRIPRLEAGQKNLHNRVYRLEALVLMALGAVTLIKGMGWLIETAHNLVATIAR